jgi:hypothetical protein
MATIHKLPALDFSRLDLAEPVDRPPIVQHEIGARCLCGRRLTDCVYTMLPTATFIAGQCPVCEGVQTAIFAPAIEQMAPQELLGRFLAFLAETMHVEETLSSGKEGRGVANENETAVVT